VKYRKIDTRIWGDEKFRLFTDDGKLAFIFLLTHPAQSALGAMRGTPAGLAAELGWPVRRLRTALTPAIEQRMVEVNEAASYIALPNFMKFNPAENPNVAQAWVSAFDLIPECPEKQGLIVRCRASLSGTRLQGFDKEFAERFGQPFTEPLPKGMPNPEPEPEPLPEPEQEPGAGVSSLPPPPLSPAAGSKNGKHSRRHVDALWGRGATP
jgi:hypothetical protein